jgi:hypothetical protein
MQNPVNEYECQTSDIGLCAALVASGFELTLLDRSNQRVNFCFANSSELEQSVYDYWSKSLLVSAVGYFEALKSVKARLYGNC